MAARCIEFAVEVADCIVEEIIMVVPERYPEYKTLAKRIESFQNMNFNVATDSLAEAGFFCVVVTARCHYCGGGIRGWTSACRPWEVHARYFSACVFVRVMKGDAFIERVLSGNTVEDQEPTGPSKCVVCLENVSNILLFPCRHLCVCASCKMQLKTCPVCRVPTLAVVRVFHV